MGKSHGEWKHWSRTDCHSGPEISFVLSGSSGIGGGGQGKGGAGPVRSVLWGKCFQARVLPAIKARPGDTTLQSTSEAHYLATN